MATMTPTVSLPERPMFSSIATAARGARSGGMVNNVLMCPEIIIIMHIHHAGRLHETPHPNLASPPTINYQSSWHALVILY
jgi:hypothetical protein